MIISHKIDKILSRVDIWVISELYFFLFFQCFAFYNHDLQKYVRDLKIVPLKWLQIIKRHNLLAP